MAATESKPKPTAGPWRVGELEHSIVLGPKGEAVCSCFFFAERGAPQGETAANARLIAAAPDLLAACERLLAAFAPPSKLSDDLIRDEMAAVRAALAKAGA